jgi:hypothetical protein
LEPDWWRLDSWKVVHRHADPITEARPASSVIVDDRPS